MSLNGLPFVYAGKITTGGTSQPLIPPNTETNTCGSAIIQARAGNAGALYLGNATTGGGTAGSLLSATTGFEMKPGESVAMDVPGLGLFYVRGITTGDLYDIMEI